MSGKSEIVHVFLQFLIQIKLYHWQTFSYPRHKGSDSLFSGIQGLVDQFIEVYQGKYGRVIVDEKVEIPLQNLDDDKIVSYLSIMKNFLVNDLENYLANKKMKNTDLLNIRDEMLGLINQTLYLFTLE